MNIQPGSSGTRKKTGRRTSDHGGGFDALCGLFASIGQVALIIILFGALFYTYIKLDQEINGADAEIRRINEECASVEREIAMLKNRRDDCSTLLYIQQQIARFDLGLKYVTQEQQQDIHLYSNAQLAQMRRYRMTSGQVAMDNNRRNPQAETR